MALSSVSSGTQAATISTEHTLLTSTSAYKFVLIVDLGNMIAGDIVELRIKMKTLTGSTARVVYYGLYANVQQQPIIISNEIPSLFSIEFTLKQTAGSAGRNFDWQVVRTDEPSLTAAQVNAEVLDVLTTDTFAEPAAVPAATSSLKDKISFLFTLARNKLTQTSSTTTLRNDADNANIATSTTSDDGTTFTAQEWT